MWSVGSRQMDVYVGLADGGLAAAWAAHEDVAQGAAHWFAEARKLAGNRWRRPKVRVWLSGALARPFLWGPIQGLACWREVELAARAAAPEATGLVGPCAVSLDEWPSSQPVLVVAMDQAVVAAIVDAAKAAGVRLLSLRPWWARVLESAADSPALAIGDTDALTVLAGSAAGWQTANSYLPRPSGEHTQPLLDRLMLSASLERGSMRHAELAREACSGPWPSVIATSSEAAA